MRLLLTGFESFGDIPRNPVQLIVEALAHDADLRSFRNLGGLSTAILPVEFAAAGERIRALIEATRPDVILMLGVAAKREAISLERIALNLDDSLARPDNAGAMLDGAPIAPDGPLALAATLPLVELCAALAAAGIPAAISNHAGAYVCNHVFYVALHTVARLGLPAACGFIHVPLPAELQPAGSAAGLSLADLIAGVRQMITFLQDERNHMVAVGEA
jgi:pyroglutamyl-peptidase